MVILFISGHRIKAITDNSHSNKNIDSLAANSTLNDNNPWNIPISSISIIEAIQTFIRQLSYQSTSKPLPIQSIKILHISLPTQVSTSSLIYILNRVVWKNHSSLWKFLYNKKLIFKGKRNHKISSLFMYMYI